jgi:hypothetical protein
MNSSVPQGSAVEVALENGGASGLFPRQESENRDSVSLGGFWWF